MEKMVKCRGVRRCSGSGDGGIGGEGRIGDKMDTYRRWGLG